MTLKLPAFLLLLSACVSAPSLAPGSCTTPCGAKVQGASDSVTCEELARYEAITLDVLNPLLDDPKRWPLCHKLSGFTIEILETHGTNAWVDDWGRNVAGLTFCEGLIQLGTDTWQLSAFAHESVHAWYCIEETGLHTGWADLGYFKAFDEVNKRFTADGGI